MSVRNNFGSDATPKDGLLRIYSVISRLRKDIFDKPPIDRHLDLTNPAANPLLDLVNSIYTYAVCLNLGTKYHTDFVAALERLRASVEASKNAGGYAIRPTQLDNLTSSLEKCINKGVPVKSSCKYGPVSKRIQGLW